MARLGTRQPDGATFDLHRGDLVVDEGAIAVGARTLAGCVLASASHHFTSRATDPASSGAAIADR
jgi:amidohydrolase